MCSTLQGFRSQLPIPLYESHRCKWRRETVMRFNPTHFCPRRAKTMNAFAIGISAANRHPLHLLSCTAGVQMKLAGRGHRQCEPLYSMSCAAMHYIATLTPSLRYSQDSIHTQSGATLGKSGTAPTSTSRHLYPHLIARQLEKEYVSHSCLSLGSMLTLQLLSFV